MKPSKKKQRLPVARPNGPDPTFLNGMLVAAHTILNTVREAIDREHPIWASTWDATMAMARARDLLDRMPEKPS